MRVGMHSNSEESRVEEVRRHLIVKFFNTHLLIHISEVCPSYGQVPSCAYIASAHLSINFQRERVPILQTIVVPAILNSQSTYLPLDHVR